MKQISKTSPVMVTGATGYVAGWIVKKLLDEGLTVHATVRNPDSPEKLKHLNELAKSVPGTIKFFQADLLDEKSFARAMQGCELVYHTASPFKSGIKDSRKGLIEPARLGTRNVLEQANKTPSVKRVVVTSSFAAIACDNADVKHTPNGVFTEDVWNTRASLRYAPYFYSKTLAEQEAWKIHDAQSRWDLIAINPALVIGPAINPHADSESLRLIGLLGDGTMKSGGISWDFGMVDVRDVAEAHYKAGFVPEARGRYIVFADVSSFVKLAGLLMPEYGQDYPLPRKAMPKLMAWLIVPMLDKSMNRKQLWRNINIPWLGDNGKGKRELGLKYRPLKESIRDTFQQMIDYGRIKPNSSE